MPDYRCRTVASGLDSLDALMDFVARFVASLGPRGELPPMLFLTDTEGLCGMVDDLGRIANHDGWPGTVGSMLADIRAELDCIRYFALLSECWMVDRNRAAAAGEPFDERPGRRPFEGAVHNHPGRIDAITVFGGDLHDRTNRQLASWEVKTVRGRRQVERIIPPKGEPIKLDGPLYDNIFGSPPH